MVRAEDFRESVHSRNCFEVRATWMPFGKAWANFHELAAGFSSLGGMIFVTVGLGRGPASIVFDFLQKKF